MKQAAGDNTHKTRNETTRQMKEEVADTEEHNMRGKPKSSSQWLLLTLLRKKIQA